jgi:hypothetical protein
MFQKIRLLNLVNRINEEEEKRSSLHKKNYSSNKLPANYKKELWVTKLI